MKSENEPTDNNYETYQRLKRLYEPANEAPKKEWIKPSDKLPPQGKKILTMWDNGDYGVRQRFGKYWFPIPYLDSRFADYEEPMYWQDIDFLGENTGYVKIMLGDQLLNIDELESSNKGWYDDFVEMQLNFFKDTRPKDEAKRT